MDDDTYRSELLRVLTDPDPTGVDPADPYGQAADGVDRYDGFSRDVVVTALDVVGGPYGDDLEVSFSLVGAPDGVPPQGATRVPFDRAWRSLSGYDDPAAYAPEVARRVMTGARRHVEHHRRSEAEERVAAQHRERARAALPDREGQRRVLLDALGGLGDVTPVAPDRFQVRLRDEEEAPDAGPLGASPDVLTFVITPEDWEEVLVAEGDDLDLFLEEAVGDPDPDEAFVVFHEGDLHRSTRVELPPVRGRARERAIARLRAGDPDGTTGGWFALDSSGDERGRA